MSILVHICIDLHALMKVRNDSCILRTKGCFVIGPDFDIKYVGVVSMDG